jgi:hypothetical protein
MSRRIGVWVDHRKAVIVTVHNGEVAVETVESGVGHRVRLSGGSRSRTPYGPQDIASDSQRQGKHQKDLTKYYRLLIDMFRDAEELYIFGPGEAKKELRSEIEKVKPLRDRIAAVETADKMTDRQVSAAVLAFFGKR